MAAAARRKGVRLVNTRDLKTLRTEQESTLRVVIKVVMLDL